MRVEIVDVPFKELTEDQKKELFELVDEVQHMDPYCDPEEQTVFQWGERYFGVTNLLSLAYSATTGEEGKQLIGYSATMQLEDYWDLEKDKTVYIGKNQNVKDWAYLAELGIAKPHRGQGLGSRLLERMEHQTMAIGRPNILLRTPIYNTSDRSVNPAIGFYKHKHGYNEVQRDGKRFVVDMTSSGPDRMFLTKRK